ncbi:hypothetical protein [Synechococcus sp. KORDI-52]|uniref:hypothetical protein n=1 Tax=Synechococcus sp. KORDI-52 TaxID=585425 RepID=UPI0008FF9420|nr:hypothetical protein [Synechococcus sp. KORDI-52]
MNSGTIRRLILTLATGYLTVFGVRQIPYEFTNEWLVLVPALILVYALTVWIEGKVFKDEPAETRISVPAKKKKAEPSTKGFKSQS